MNVSLSGYELRAVQASLNETLHGPRHVNLGDDFQAVTGLTKDQGEALCHSLLDVINRGNAPELRPAIGPRAEQIDLEQQAVNGLVAALQRCIECMKADGDFRARMNLSRVDAVALKQKLAALLEQ